MWNTKEDLSFLRMKRELLILPKFLELVSEFFVEFSNWISEESGWKPPQLSEEELRAYQVNLKEVMARIKDHPSSWPFLKPVNASEVPDYYQVIKDPIGKWFNELELIGKIWRW